MNSNFRFPLLSLLTLLLLAITKAHSLPYPFPHVEKFDGFFKEYDKHRLDLIAKFFAEDPVIFDAGAFNGLEILEFKKTWPNCTVYCFEPNPRAFNDLLLKNISGIPGIYPYNLALSNAKGEAVLYLNHGYYGDNHDFEGASSLLEPLEWKKLDFQGPKITVPCVVLQDWMEENQIDHIDMMWLDLEGLELQILQSSPKVLEKVKVIYTETNLLPFRHGTTLYINLKEFLEKNGFELLAHWYYEGYQGDAIFVKSKLFDLAFED